MIIAIAGIIIVLGIYFIMSHGRKKQQQVWDAVNQIYKILQIKDAENKSKLINAGILYALVDTLFLDVPSIYSQIKRMQVYVAMARENEFSEDDVNHIKEFLFNIMQNENKLSKKALLYWDFIKELSQSVSLLAENYKNGHIGEDENMKIFYLKIKLILDNFTNQEEFPESISGINTPA